MSILIFCAAVEDLRPFRSVCGGFGRQQIETDSAAEDQASARYQAPAERLPQVNYAKGGNQGDLGGHHNADCGSGNADQRLVNGQLGGY